jgi:FkbM family methyltransferase
MLKEIKNRIKKLIGKDLRYTTYRIPGKLEKLGSSYGGWTIPTDLLGKDSVCYLAGAGEDISFDIALAERFQCPVLIFDPTPKARLHFENLMAAAKTGRPLPFSHGTYTLSEKTAQCLQFFQIGLWTKNDSLRFYAPKNDEHVSHSISNLQQTEKYFEAKVERLSSLMKQNGHDHIDLLKIDIEGAEFDVIDTLIRDGVAVKIFCVEFHKREKGFAEIRQAIRKLEKAGYGIIAREELDFTFLKKNLIP